jgi:ABC-type multidrug transport system fused ATPase/permease subunit
VGELPLGLETPVGDRGERLSGGQAQRLAVARAFLKDAPVVVLDEPTSQLDPGTEAEIAGAIARLRRGRSTLLIAHRLTTVSDADLLVVLAGGRVVETGSPAALRQGGTAYARMLAACEGRA